MGLLSFNVSTGLALKSAYVLNGLRREKETAGQGNNGGGDYGSMKYWRTRELLQASYVSRLQLRKKSIDAAFSGKNRGTWFERTGSVARRALLKTGDAGLEVELALEKCLAGATHYGSGSVTYTDNFARRLASEVKAWVIRTMREDSGAS